MTYDRSKRMFDEPHSPAHIDKIVAAGNRDKGKFLKPQYAQSYLMQMRIVGSLPHTTRVIEVGPGEEFVARNMRSLGYEYHTIDKSDLHNPTMVADFADFDASPLAAAYDAACAFQVLEHFPYEQFKPLLRKLASMSKRHVVISLPYSCNGERVTKTFCRGQAYSSSKSEKFTPTNLPNRVYRPEFVAEFPWAVHYWEIGRQGFPLSRILADVGAAGLKVYQHLHGHNPYHYFIKAGVV